jgi:hypothetical protein
MSELLSDFIWWILEGILDLGTAFLDMVLLRGRTTRRRHRGRKSQRADLKTKTESTRPPAKDRGRSPDKSAWTLARAQRGNHDD